MSRLIEALREEVKTQSDTHSSDMDIEDSPSNQYPDYSDYTDHSDSSGWGDNWNDGPNHSDSWSDTGWPYKR